MSKQTLDLQLVICPTREPEAKYRDYYQKIYECWSIVWEAAYNEVNYKKRADDLKSDGFTRNDYAVAIFLNQQCIGLLLYRCIDFSLPTTRDDSFFTQWSEIHRKSLSKLGRRFLVAGNLAVSPAFRQKNLGISLKDLIVGSTAEIILQSNADAAIATPRRDKKVHESCYEWGAIPIAQDVPWGCGIRIDLVAFCKENVAKKRDQPLRPYLDELWQNKLVISEQVLETAENFKGTLPYSLQNKTLKKKTG